MITDMDFADVDSLSEDVHDLAVSVLKDSGQILMLFEELINDMEALEYKTIQLEDEVYALRCLCEDEPD